MLVFKYKKADFPQTEEKLSNLSCPITNLCFLKDFKYRLLLKCEIKYSKVKLLIFFLKHNYFAYCIDL